MHATLRFSAFVVGGILTSTVGGCVTTQSDARLLYEHCRNSTEFWSAYVAQGGPKVMVAGLNHGLDGNRLYNCYWRHGNDYAQARDAAMARCRQE